MIEYNQFKNIIDTTLEGLPVSDEQKKSLWGMYMFSYYRFTFELLFTKQLPDEDYHLRLLNFFKSELDMLRAKGDTKIDTLLEEKGESLVVDILNTLKEKLPEEAQAVIQKNIDSLDLQ